ncbi:SgcJ/EcaC family oxidoreductase [Paraburkholderia terrae]
MKKILIAAAVVFSTGVFAGEAHVPMVYHEIAAAPTNKREAEIASLFDRWNAALATGDAISVAKLYAPDAVLEPTVSNEVRTTPAGIKDYFVTFLKLKPHGTINLREIRLLNDNSAVDTGVYTFELMKNGKHQKVQARYTFVYKNVDGEWKILNHHSSAMPE